MNKKLFLLSLPALLVLSSCNGLNNQPAQKDIEYFKESTVNEEAVFGAAEEIGDLGLRRTSPLKLDALTSDFVKIGYQIQFDDKGDSDDSNDVISVRFVAAIKNAGVTAFWKRGLAQPNGVVGAAPDGEHWKFKFEDTAKESKKMYSSLANGESVITAKAGDYVGYEGFVIYTLTNIPYNDFYDSYLAAYVILTDTSNPENTIKSKAIALELKTDDGIVSKNDFSFNPGANGHFLEGKINNVVRDGSDDSTHSLLWEDETTVSSDQNYASYSNVDLKTSDSFGSFYYSPTVFQYFGHDWFFGKSKGFLDGVDDHYSHPTLDGNYNFYIKNKNTPAEENFVYSYANSYTTDPTLIMFYPNSWDVDGAIYRIYAWNDEDAHTWITPVGSNVLKGKTVWAFNLNKDYPKFKFTRCNPTAGDDVGSGWVTGDNHKVWNESAEHNYSFFYSAGCNNVFRITAAGNNNSDLILYKDFIEL